jgi:hypothetical protein
MSRSDHKCASLTPLHSNRLTFRAPLFGARNLLFRDYAQLQLPAPLGMTIGLKMSQLCATLNRFE